ncbi:TRAFAC clade GTPase domain-containing protein [Salipiger marinus]|uniref:TRAFAC clade GTPase domain-containing protein n=1 Tax=Salipiger marinus TaxID=555512 RepID=UPI0040593CCA
MSGQEIMVLGFQASGKTTFAAALWHLVDSREINDTALVKGKHNGDFRYLEEISAAWAAGWVVGRTLSEEWRPIAINLRRVVPETDIRLSFVDIAGETVERIFVTREVDDRVEPLIRDASGLLLFVSALRPKDDDSIVDLYLEFPNEAPPESADEPAEAGSSASAAGPGEAIPFKIEATPQQVQLVDLLDSLADEPLEMRPERIAVIISAWDRAHGASTPEAWLEDHMPLLFQYLATHADEFETRIYGVSAQGGHVPSKENPAEPSDRAELLMQPEASRRISVVGHGAGQHDLTHPIAWLSGVEI